MNFEKLDVWKRSLVLSVSLYKAFVANKDYGFKDQITRAGLSIPSNIAEGMERETAPDKTRFLTIAKSSCGELRTQLYVAVEIGYLNSAIANTWINESYEISRMLTGLIKTIRS